MTQLLNLTHYLFIGTILFDGGVLGFVLWNRVSKIHWAFVVALSVTITWEITLWLNFFWRTDIFVKTTLNHIVFALGPVVLYSIIIFLEQFNRQRLLSKIFHVLLATVVAILFGLCAFGLVSTTLQYYGSQPYQFFTSTTPLLQVYYLSFIPLSVVIFYQIITIYRQLTGYRKQQAKYILVGLLVSYVLATIANIWFPMLHTFLPNTSVDHAIQINTLVQIYGAMACSIWTATTAYAITRHRLFSIRLIIKQPVMQAVAIILFTIVFLLIWAIGYQLWSADFVTLLLFTATDFIIFVSVLIYVFKRLMFTPEFDFSIPNSLDVAVNTTTTLQTLVKQLDGVLQSKFAVQGSSLLVLNWQEQIYQSFQTTNKILEKISLPRVHSLVYVMRTQPQLITLQQLQGKSDLSYSLQQDILQFFKKYNLAAVLPLLNDVDVYGFVVIPAAAILPEDLTSRKDDLMNLSRKFGMVLQQILTYDALIKQL